MYVLGIAENLKATLHAQIDVFKGRCLLLFLRIRSAHLGSGVRF